MAFDPSQVAGLTLAWRPDAGVILGAGNAIATVAGAFGTSAVLTAGTNPPQIAPGLGPLNQNLFQFIKANAQYATFPPFTAANATFIMVIAPNPGGGLAELFVHTNTNSVSMSAAGSFRVFPVGGTNLDVIPQSVNNSNLQIVTIIYSAAGGGTVNAFVDGNAQPAVTGLGAGGFNQLNEFGGLNGINTLQGYVGPILVYNRAITDSERQQIEAYLAPWRGLTIYVDNIIGGDTNAAFWNPLAPLKSPPTAVGLNWHGGETIAINSTQTFRETVRVAPRVSAPIGNPVTIDGGLWPDPAQKAHFRYSIAPVPVLVSGTVYNIGAVTIPNIDVAGDTGYVYIVPGGVVSFGGVARLNTRGTVFPAYDTTNVIRLSEDKINPTTPAVGKWGQDASGNVFVNAGFALNPGDVEASVIPSNILVAAFFNDQADNWIWRRMVVQFALGDGFVNVLSANITADRIEAWFNQFDGVDATANGYYIDQNPPATPPGLPTFPLSQITTQNYQIIDCIAAFNGAFPTSGGNPGDGFSQHMNTTGTYFRCSAINNDKSVTDHKGGTTIVCHECYGVGNSGFWLSSDNPESTGSMTLYNCINETPAGLSASNPYGAWMSGNGGTLTCYNCTFIADVAAANYIGIFSLTPGGAVIAKNNIVDGFAVGLGVGGPTPFTSDYNLINATQSYNGVAHGAHDIIAPGQFINEPTNLRPSFMSRAIGSGTPIPGVTIDYTGALRSSSAPTIGAFEVAVTAQGGSSGPAYGQTYDRKIDEEDEEAMLALLH